MGVIPNPKMSFTFPISCILVLIFPIFMIYFPKCEGKGSFQNWQIKSLLYLFAILWGVDVNTEICSFWQSWKITLNRFKLQATFTFTTMKLQWSKLPYHWYLMGGQWLSGRVLDSRRRGHGFEPHRHHCVVSLSKNINPSLVLVQPRKTCPFKTERLLMRRKESNQTNKKLVSANIWWHFLKC